MFGKIGDMANMLKKAQEMQSKMKEMQAKVAATRFDVEMIEDLVKAAFVAAQTKAAEAMKEELTSMTGEMGLPPGLDKMLGGQ